MIEPKSHGRKAIRQTLTPRALMEGPPELKGAWVARVVTLFPECFPGVLGASLTGKALQEGLWRLETIDLRLFGEGRHRNVDDTPAGGGAGMVMRADIVAARAGQCRRRHAGRPRPLAGDLPVAARKALHPGHGADAWPQTEGLTLLCGRFEGVDERVIETRQIAEVSIGDYRPDRRRDRRSGLDRRDGPAYTPRAWESGVGRGGLLLGRFA